ncbi:glycoside hydrolase family 99 protein [Allonocardiopsis opalescens]|uniref:Glycosyl hydrolase family 99 n=1 Tax=Allonocardiopsis opalescens TaxID=1144618 RepID=A0A2T0Q1Y1_9ACTN|nr:glycoside hydrolase family 99 protein [Allonocardiopsis opalescens]PRX97803.1 glycosyl hydrolase family 99 [Allonocardiopsis opalescens]
MSTRRSFLAGSAGLLGAAALGGAAFLRPAPALGDAVRPAAPLSRNVHAFYYSWYANPQVTGEWLHWQQGGFTPPADIGSDFYPVLGAYDSGDFAGAVARHMAWLSQAGIGVICYSWWGRGDHTDRVAPGVLDAAQAHGIQVNWHLEPHAGRTSARAVIEDIAYIEETYGSHPAFYRAADLGNRGAYYVFQSLFIADWSPIAALRDEVIIMSQTTDVSRSQDFGGMYTYDAIAAAAGNPEWEGAGEWCAANGRVWAPSVGPGYIDDRAVPGNTTPTVDRENGAVYDRCWEYALREDMGGPPTWVSVTSFNEWHEGSQLEPATASPPGSAPYLDYEGAYGRTGTGAETAYLDRTAYWVERYEAVRAARR